MSYADDDLRRMARDYVRRQCSYMDMLPTDKEIDKAARKVYRALKEIEDERRAPRRRP